MVTDNERREVARRLRGIKDTREGCGHELCCDLWAAIFDSDYRCTDLCDECEVAVLDYLADLIEPNRGSGGRTILCAHCENVSWCGCEPGDEEGGCDFEPSVTEGEPPYNLYSLYEVVFRRRPHDKYAIEDDEVEELVDALLDICNAPGHDVIQRPQPSYKPDAKYEAWYNSLSHYGDERGGPSTIRELIEEIVWAALTVDLGPNGNTDPSTGIDEGGVYTNNLFAEWEREASRLSGGIDRDALLALADEMQGYADGASSGDGFPYVNAGSLWSYADRIREACGEAVA